MPWAMALECLECLWSWWSCMITGAWIPQRNVQTFKGLLKSAMYSMCLFEKFSCVEKPPVMGLHRMRYTENILIELLRMLLELLGRQVLSLSNLCPIYDCLTISILFPCGFSVLRDLDVSYMMINDVINRLCCRTQDLVALDKMLKAVQATIGSKWIETQCDRFRCSSSESQHTLAH